MVKFKWAALEVFKFSLYLSIPAGMTFGLIRNPEHLQVLKDAFMYVEHPVEGPSPPSLEELQAILAKEKQARK